ncbi:antitoxin Xre/MbcA/ParS toxin-binding domain-containing protein [Aeromonas sp. s6]|uniref:antitoxin Xre/MbcA/ParS toxin-binding domain-containing protein n=1 Tax=Aeromonas sp. s6 TaxID=3138488 RepID=UPI0034A341BE
MISMTKADLRLAVQRLISSSIVMLMSVISTHYDLSRISVGHYTRVYGVVLALDAALSLQEDDALRALSWLHRPARGLGGVAPATLLTTQMGVQAVIDLVGRIQHGVCI